MPRILRSPRALIDVAEIWDFIAEDSVARADAFIDMLDEKLNLLAHRPTIGRTRDDLVENLRSLPLGRHVICFVP